MENEPVLTRDQEEAFEKFLKLYTNSEEQRAKTRSLKPSLKLVMLEQWENMAKTDSPNVVLSEFLRDPSDLKALRKLEQVLRTSSLEWVAAFVNEEKGHLKLFEIIKREINKPLYKLPSKEYLQKMVDTVYAIMNNRVGLDAVLELDDSLETLIEFFKVGGSRILGKIFVILSAVMALEDSSDRVLNLMDDYYEKYHLQKYSNIVSELYININDPDFVMKAFSFINLLLYKTQDNLLRFSIRYKFINCGLDYLYKNRIFENSEEMKRQVEQFLSLKRADDKLFREIYGTDMFNHEDPYDYYRKLEQVLIDEYDNFKKDSPQAEQDEMFEFLAALTELLTRILYKVDIPWSTILNGVVHLFEYIYNEYEAPEAVRKSVIGLVAGKEVDVEQFDVILKGFLGQFMDKKTKMKLEYLETRNDQIEAEIKKATEEADGLYEERQGIIKKFEKVRKEVEEHDALFTNDFRAEEEKLKNAFLAELEKIKASYKKQRDIMEADILGLISAIDKMKIREKKINEKIVYVDRQKSEELYESLERSAAISKDTEIKIELGNGNIYTLKVSEDGRNIDIVGSGRVLQEGGGGAPPLPGSSNVPGAPPLPGGSKVPGAPPLPGGAKIPGAPPLPGGSKIPGAPPLPGGSKIPGAPPLPGGAKIPGAPPLPGGAPRPPGAPPLPGGAPRPPGAPPLPGGAPRPPGAPPLGVPGIPKKPNPKPKEKVVSFFWDKLPDRKATELIWKDIDESNVDLSEDEFIEFFSAKKKAAAKQARGKKKEAKEKPKEVVLIPDEKKAKNVTIVLSTVKIPFPQLVKELRRVNFDVLTPSVINKISTVIPEPEEIEIVKSYDGDPERLRQMEKFFYYLSKIPRVKQRVECIKFRQGWKEILGEAEPDVMNLHKASTEVVESKAFRELLKIILRYGNYMNGGSRRGGAYGFKLKTLNKLKNTKSTKDRRMTLVHFIAKTIREDNPELIENLREELSAVKDASILAISEIRKKVGKVRRGATMLSNEIKFFEKNPQLLEGADDKFVEVMSGFSKDAMAKLEKLEKQMEEGLKKFLECKKLFGEPEKQEPAEFFGEINTFLQYFYRSLDEMDQWKKQDEERRKKEKRLKEFEEMKKKKKKSKKSENLQIDDGKNVMDNILDQMKSGALFNLKSVNTGENPEQGWRTRNRRIGNLRSRLKKTKV